MIETRVFSRKDHNDKKCRAEDQEKINEIKEKFQADIDKIKSTCANAMVGMLAGKTSGSIVDFDTHEVRIPEAFHPFGKNSPQPGSPVACSGIDLCA